MFYWVIVDEISDYWMDFKDLDNREHGFIIIDKTERIYVKKKNNNEIAEKKNALHTVYKASKILYIWTHVYYINPSKKLL